MMKYTKILKVFVFLSLMLTLTSCSVSLEESVIYRLEDSGYEVFEIEFEEVERIEPDFEVVGAEKVYIIYDRMNRMNAYLYVFRDRTELEMFFEDLELDIEEYEDQIYNNLLVVPYEKIEYIGSVLSIIKR